MVFGSWVSESGLDISAESELRILVYNIVTQFLSGEKIGFQISVSLGERAL
jgi:hypothetical protein